MGEVRSCVGQFNRLVLHRPCRPVGCEACRLTSKIRAPLKTEELFKELLVEFAVK